MKNIFIFFYKYIFYDIYMKNFYKKKFCNSNLKKLKCRYRFYNYNYASTLDSIIKDKIFGLFFKEITIYEDVVNFPGHECHNYNLFIFICILQFCKNEKYDFLSYFLSVIPLGSLLFLPYIDTIYIDRNMLHYAHFILSFDPQVSKTELTSNFNR
jgi:hypothetical protein